MAGQAGFPAKGQGRPAARCALAWLVCLLTLLPLLPVPAIAQPPLSRSQEVSKDDYDRLLRRCGPGADAPERLRDLRVEMLRAVNRERRAKGYARLRPHSVLHRVAQKHALDMARRGVMSHRGGDGSSVSQRAERFGYDYQVVSENLARGQPEVPEVVRDWMGSPGHRANILLTDGEDLGVGFATGAHEKGASGAMLPGCFWVIVVGSELPG